MTHSQAQARHPGGAVNQGPATGPARRLATEASNGPPQPDRRLGNSTRSQSKPGPGYTPSFTPLLAPRLGDCRSHVTSKILPDISTIATRLINIRFWRMDDQINTLPQTIFGTRNRQSLATRNFRRSSAVLVPSSRPGPSSLNFFK